ncbi:hypothetical protein ACFL0A_01595 [Patescibacteria group bacterium]
MERTKFTDGIVVSILPSGFAIIAVKFFLDGNMGGVVLFLIVAAIFFMIGLYGLKHMPCFDSCECG